mgnify:CR=1 FL=1
MWLYLKTGFYSVVHKEPCKKEELLIRARAWEDIDALRQVLKDRYSFEGVVIDTPEADYAYRMVVPRQTFALFILNAAVAVRYDNFKNTISINDHPRHNAYMRCWKAMYEWQKNLQSVRRKS